MRETLIAQDGMILTNGEIYGKQIHLEEGMNKAGFYEITEVEYLEAVEEQEKTQEI